MASNPFPSPIFKLFSSQKEKEAYVKPYDTTVVLIETVQQVHHLHSMHIEIHIPESRKETNQIHMEEALFVMLLARAFNEGILQDTFNDLYSKTSPQQD